MAPRSWSRPTFQRYIIRTHCPYYGRIMYLWNVGLLVRDFAALYPRKAVILKAQLILVYNKEVCDGSSKYTTFYCSIHTRMQSIKLSFSSPMSIICPTHLILLNLNTPTTFVEEYRLYNSSLCNNTARTMFCNLQMLFSFGFKHSLRHARDRLGHR
jgi:hypothetical protein